MMAEEQFEKYRLRIETLTPLHIGSGEGLREGFDFFTDNDNFYRLNHGKLFEKLIDEIGEQYPSSSKEYHEIIKKNFSSLINEGYLDLDMVKNDKHFVSYCISTSGHEITSERLFSTCIKNPKYQPYIPGSSLKGAFRSILLRQLVQADNKPLIIDTKNKKKAAQATEEKFYCSKPSSKNKANYDVWRAIRFTDSSFVDYSCLNVGRTQVYPVKDKDNNYKSIDIFMEVIPAGISFETSLSLDLWLFKQKPFNDPKYLEWIQSFPKYAKDDFVARLEIERNFLDYYEYILVKDISYTKGFYNELENSHESLLENEFIISLGFGTGWIDKTLGYVMSEKLMDEFNNITTKLDLGKGQWFHDDIFPRTRTVVSDENQTRVPLGVVKIRMDRVE